MKIILAALLLSITITQAELIPAIRKTDWTPNVRVGVPGGIINRTSPVINVVTNPLYLAPVNTAADCEPAIQSAINDAASGSVIYLPAGTYNLDNIINLKSNITLRGDGSSLTILNQRAGGNSAGVLLGALGGFNWSWPPGEGASQGALVSAGGGKDSTAITVPDGSLFNVGDVIMMAWGERMENAAIEAGAVPIGMGRPYNLYNSAGAGPRQNTRITAIAGNVLTIFPPITGDFGDIASAAGRHKGMKVWAAQGQFVQFAGVEGMTITCPANPNWNTKGLEMGGVYACWAIDVKCVGQYAYPFQVYDALQIEFKKCYAHQGAGGGSNGAGYLLNYVSSSLFYDNAVTQSFPGWELNFGTSGNVIAYNYGFDSFDKTYTLNHGPHNTCNLFEGNIGSSMVSDGYFGGSSEDTLFRNWLNGEQGYSTSFKRFTRNPNLIGNVLGYTGGPNFIEGEPIFSFGQPNIGSGGWTGDATPTSGDFWDDWKATGTLTTRTTDTSGVITINAPANTHANLDTQRFNITWNNRDNAAFCEVVWNPSIPDTRVVPFTTATTLPTAGTAIELHMLPDGFQEFDHNVSTSSIQKANWANGIGYQAGAIGVDALPNSLYLSAKPTWFGSLTWPPFDPVAGTHGHTRIPAGYRFVHGVDPPPEGSGSGIETWNVQNLRVGP